jgi:chromosome partitioning protein
LLDNIKNVKDYHYILLDCPGSLNVLTTNALICSNSAIITSQTELFSTKGLGKLFSFINGLKRSNKDLVIEGILFTMYNKQRRIDNDCIDIIKELPVPVFKTSIRKDVKLVECSGFQKSIFDYAPGSKGSTDYNNFKKEIISKWKKIKKVAV